MTDLNDLSYGQHGDGTMPDTSNKGTSAAASINQAGVIVGDSDSSLQVNSGFYWEISSNVQHAVRFDGGSPVDLGIAPPVEAGWATADAINDSGSIIGFQSSIDSDGGYFVAGGQIETLPFGPNGLNNLDQVVGTIRQGSRFLASMWVNKPLVPGVDRVVDLDAIARNSGFVGSSFASKIGDRVEILGEATPPGSFQNTGAIWRNGQITRLDDMLGDPTWLITTAAINANGMIAATGFNTVAQNGDRALLLLPVELMVDGNRDGEMSFTDALIHDRDGTTQEKPYRFWLNDDQDAISGTNTPSEVVPVQQFDNSDGHIQSTRDCEDLTRLWINLKGLTSVFKDGNIKVVLKLRNTDGTNPELRLFRSVETSDGQQRYLTDEAWAAAQITPPFDQALLAAAGGGTVVSSTTGVYLNSEFWNGLSEESSEIYLLFEGVSEGKGELYLEFTSNGQKIGESPGVWLDLKNIKTMYERAKVTSAPDPIVPPSTTPSPAHDPLEPRMGWVQDPNGNPPEYSPSSWYESKQYIILVHGWNMSYDDSQNYAETMFKRLWQRGYKGRFARLYWPTLVGDFTFNDSEYRAWKCGESLRQFVASLPNDYTRNIVAHSMGNIVVGSALLKGMEVANYALCHAALSAFCYDDRIDASGTSVLDENWGYSTPCYDTDGSTRDLSYRYKLNAVSGNLINFFLSADDALQKWEWNNDTPSNGGRYPVIGAKPQPYNLGATGYYYHPERPVGQRLGLAFLAMPNRLVNTPHEAMTYVCQSPTKAVGAQGETAGSIGSKVDLATFGFNDVHSAEYNFTVQQTKLFYNKLLEKFQLSFIP